MSTRRVSQAGVARLAGYLVRVLTHLKPQQWCPPAISLRLFRLHARAANEAVTADLRRHVPASGWSLRRDLVYGPGPRHRLDLAVPDAPGPHPLVVWVHGGGWHFGDKGDVLPYGQALAAQGFAVAVPNYPLAPGARYPEARDSVAAALEHLREQAAGLDLDPERLVLAGDSAGAQLVGELALRPDLRLRGLVLFCGAYDQAAVEDSDRMFAAVLGSAMWAITGRRRWQDSPACARMNVVERVTAAFPPTFLGSGRQDPLHRRQSAVLSQRLQELGVDLEEFFPGDEAEPSFHEFQMHRGTPAGEEAFARVVRFLGRVTSNSH